MRFFAKGLYESLLSITVMFELGEKKTDRKNVWNFLLVYPLLLYYKRHSSWIKFSHFVISLWKPYSTDKGIFSIPELHRFECPQKQPSKGAL